MASGTVKWFNPVKATVSSPHRAADQTFSCIFLRLSVQALARLTKIQHVEYEIVSDRASNRRQSQG